jgi:hypothetical protein
VDVVAHPVLEYIVAAMAALDIVAERNRRMSLRGDVQNDIDVRPAY